jgi:hypothetical protein
MNIRFHATTVTLLAALVLAAPAAAQFSEPALLDKPQAGYYRLKIGKVDVIAVSDGGAARSEPPGEGNHGRALSGTNGTGGN